MGTIAIKNKYNRIVLYYVLVYGKYSTVLGNVFLLAWHHTIIKVIQIYIQYLNDHTDMLTTRQLNIIYTVLHILNNAYNQNYSCSYELLPKPRISNESNEYTISLLHEEYLCFNHLVCHNFQMGGLELIISITILLLYCNYTILITYIYLYYNCKLFQIR